MAFCHCWPKLAYISNQLGDREMEFRTTYVASNQEDQDRINFLHGQIEWADKVMAAPNVVYQNGRESHEVAHQIWSESQDELINYLGITPI